jgi:hypothetical protein
MGFLFHFVLLPILGIVNLHEGIKRQPLYDIPGFPSSPIPLPSPPVTKKIFARDLSFICLECYLQC